ncbi:malto-oligosyltrehalose synthase [Acuticoccus sp.]|uniref:malto-oligosyltrehalose synthase n=1 Tax=Acuticoccus sp. TaxID=1904378 RepID=UPI003B528D55
MIRATYRVQVREGVGFEDVARIVPHLADAGISHLYAAPVFAATSGSTHGYDVTDHNGLDPTLGGEAAFEVLVRALQEAGVGLILDIVPNHMAASMENPWWRDVAEHGQESRFADHFDIDWAAGKLTLPILGKPYGEALAAGDVRRSDTADGPVLSVPGADLPIAPGTEGIADVDALHEAQHYRLTHWRLGRDGINYRRFFEVTGLVGARVEDPKVFDAVHRLILTLVREGKVQGLRVDHVDGLADPAGTLGRLAEHSGVPILVEKILGTEEQLPPGWPVDGTTGYEFIAGLAALFVDPEGLASLGEAYGDVADADAERVGEEAKELILTRNLAGELERLVALALRLFADDRSARDHGRATVREGLVALMTALDVYRTYLPSDDPADREVLARARAKADAAPLEDKRILDDLVALMQAPGPDAVRLEFIRRLQQTSGPLMAKAVEDTLFYRYHRLVGLNEVGGELAPELGPERFLAVASEGGLAATQTHDTKRGEDARARLYALSDPGTLEAWSKVWHTLPGDVPPKLRWAMAQMLFASDPITDDPDFAHRFREAALKTVREAKEETTWTRPDEAFEGRVAAAAEAMAAARDRLAPLEPVARAGAVIGLAQALLKCIGRRAPDVYQGTFGWDQSMVDPDNRRPVDFAAEAALCERARAAEPATLLADWRDGAVKARCLLEGLALRRERPQLFADGRLETVPLSGREAGRFAAFRQRDGEACAVVVVPTRPLALLEGEGIALSEERLDDLAMSPGVVLRSRLAPGELDAADAGLATMLAAFPILLATSW